MFFLKKLFKKVKIGFRLLIWNFWQFFPRGIKRTNTSQGIFYFYTKDQFISKQLYLFKSYGYQELEKAYSLLKDHGFLGNGKCKIIDIGANIGTVCISALKKNFFEEALAIEPVPDNTFLLKKNSLANNLSSKIKFYPYAISNRRGKLTMKLSNDNYGDHRVLSGTDNKPVKNNGNSFDYVDVPVLSFDELVLKENLDLNNVGLIWMDTQGHDYFVLRGMEKTLSFKIPIVFEFYPSGIRQEGIQQEEFFDFIKTRFNYFYNLREPFPVKLSTDKIINLFSRYQKESFTDLLLLP